MSKTHNKYTYHTYGVARVQLPEGVYSLVELKDIVATLEKLNLAAQKAMVVIDVNA